MRVTDARTDVSAGPDRFVGSPRVLFVRSRGAASLVRDAALVLIVLALVPVGLEEHPLGLDVGVFVLQNAAAVTGLVWGPRVSAPWRELEATVPVGRLRRRRAEWIVIGTIFLTWLGLAVLGLRGLTGWYLVGHLRNALFAVGVATASGCLLGRAASWVPLALYTVTCWLFGTCDAIATARWWALLNQPPDSLLAGTVALAVWVGGAAAYVVRDGRQA